ncbi:MAG: hypothetical protein RLZZ180_2692, partial [Pseudomonadota bacterium]
ALDGSVVSAAALIDAAHSPDLLALT